LGRIHSAATLSFWLLGAELRDAGILADQLAMTRVLQRGGDYAKQEELRLANSELSVP
jgi:hypothetical protein